MVERGRGSRQEKLLYVQIHRVVVCTGSHSNESEAALTHMNCVSTTCSSLLVVHMRVIHVASSREEIMGKRPTVVGGLSHKLIPPPGGSQVCWGAKILREIRS